MRPYPLDCDALVDDLLADLDGLTDDVKRCFAPLTDAQLAWQPTPEGWGVGNCLVHLARSNELYRQALTPAFRTARAESRVASAPQRGGWFGRWFTGAVGPSVRIKVKAPVVVRPRQRAVEEGSVETFLAEQHRTQELVQESRGLDLDFVRIASPIASWMKFRASDALRIVVEHEKRHIKQAHSVLAHAAFPR